MVDLDVATAGSSNGRNRMTTFEMIQKLAKYPADTPLVLAYNWGDPQLDVEYRDDGVGGRLIAALHGGEMTAGESSEEEVTPYASFSEWSPEMDRQ